MVHVFQACTISGEGNRQKEIPWRENSQGEILPKEILPKEILPKENLPKENLRRKFYGGKFLEGNYPRPFPVGKFVTQLVLKTVSVKSSGSWISVFAASSSITSIFHFKTFRSAFA